MNDVGSSEERYYVYIYHDPRDGTPFYVGKGTGDRLYGHLKETLGSTDNVFKVRKILSIANSGLAPIIYKVVEDVSESDAYTIECHLIAQFGRIGIDEGGTLTNRCIDQRPPSPKGRKFSEEHKKKLSEAYWKRVSQPGYVHPCKGKAVSEHVKEAARQAHKGKPKSEEQKRKISETKKNQYASGEYVHHNLGQNLTEEIKKNISNAKKAKGPSQKALDSLKQMQLSNVGSERSEETKRRIAGALAESWEITDREDNVFIIQNLKSWCKERGFAYQNFQKVAKGQLKHAYGYKCRKIVDVKPHA